MSRLVRASVLALVVACLVACQAAVVGRPFTATFPEREGNIAALPVTVRDTTGLVTDIAIGDAADLGEGVGKNDRGDILAAGWTGGACDKSVTLVLTRTADGYVLTVTPDRGGAVVVCDAIGIPRGLFITLAAPINAPVQLRGGP